MPNPNFMPLIGSSFDSLGAQDQFWAGFNRQTEEGNFARANAAQDKANQYAMQVSEAQRQDAFHAARMQQAAAEQAAAMRENQQSKDRHAYEFGVQTDLTKNAQKINEDRYAFAEKAKTDAENKSTSAAEDVASTLAPTAQATADKRDAARERAQAAQVEATTIKAKLMSELSGAAQLDKSQKMFIPVNVIDPNTKLPDTAKNEENRQKALEANNRMADAVAQAQLAAEDFNTHASAFEALRAQAHPYQLLLNEDGTIHNPWTKKTYGGMKAQAPAAAIAPPDTTTSQIPWNPSVNLSAPGATDGTGTTGYQWGAAQGSIGPIESQQPTPNPVAQMHTKIGRDPIPQSIANLLKHPETANFFDEKYGAGASAKYLNSNPNQEPNPVAAQSLQPPAEMPVAASVPTQSSKTIPLDSPEFDPPSAGNESIFQWVGNKLNPSKADRLKFAQQKYPGAKIVKIPGGMIDTLSGKQWQDDQFVVQLP